MTVTVENTVIMSQRSEITVGDFRDRKIEIGTFAGPTSYLTGGFTIDRSSVFSRLETVDIQLITGSFLGRFDIISDWSTLPPGAGQFKIKMLSWTNVLGVLTELETTALTNLSTLTFRYSAMGLAIPFLL